MFEELCEGLEAFPGALTSFVGVYEGIHTVNYGF
jgi:hypothetical protein